MMEGVTSLPGDVYKADLDFTLRELTSAIAEAEEAVKRVRATASRVPDADLSAVDSLEIMIKAYNEVAASEPFLPSRGSVLPALLALQKAHQTTEETNAYVASSAVTLDQTKKRVEAEQLGVKEQRDLQAALQKRIASLREELETKEEKTPEQLAKEKAAELKQQKKHYDQQTASLMKSLDWFIENHLASMLAAEELGGPVVGDLTEIDPDELSAGFSAHGKLKKAKENPDDDKRQRRIDEIWGGASEPQEAKGKRKRDRDEASAAGSEMRDLIEQLLNQTMESGGDSSAAYVRVDRESAAARFLVRSKVAEFHPKDAMRLRLIDFGRELDD
ncbi:hypothetical protein QBC47DRAFT_203806 [Echria macrotheca]|uniref:Uncharacterized protein n=1 Tax=Echria macrotheca TaxID=438768 RepID=A0AAJ0BAW7_9PEZI|nr:hypothetical protein QBC47DRAFT_203806 [Echria macrotheca]